jgi:hypothetical protein
MASWLLNCKNCSEPFAYSLIPDTLADLSSALATCVPSGWQGTRVPPLQNQIYLPANRPEISEQSRPISEESIRPISANHAALCSTRWQMTWSAALMGQLWPLRTYSMV